MLSLAWKNHKMLSFSLNAVRWKEKHKIWSDFLPLQIKKNEIFNEDKTLFQLKLFYSALRDASSQLEWEMHF